MSEQTYYVVMASRNHCDYPVAVFDERNAADWYAAQCNRVATFAEYRVAGVPFNPLVSGQVAARYRRPLEPLQQLGISREENS